MNKKRAFLVLVSLVFMGLFSNLAFAQEEGLGGVADTIQKLFGFIPDIITIDKLVGGETASLFWAKFLVWILIFATIYFGAGFVFKEQKRIQVVVSIAVSLIGVLAIPNSIIVNIFQTYGLAAGFAVWFVPVIGGLFLAHKIENKAVKVVFYLLLIMIMLSMDKTLTSPGSYLDTNEWVDYFRLLFAVVVIAFFWNIITMFGGGGAVGDRVGGWGSSAWDKLTGGGDGGGGDRGDWRERDRDDGELRRLEEVEETLERHERDLTERLERAQDDEIEVLRELAELIRELQQVQTQIRNLGGLR